VLDKGRLKGYEFIHDEILRAHVGEDNAEGPPNSMKKKRQFNLHLIDSDFMLHD
jgi:hypothetical protein